MIVSSMYPGDENYHLKNVQHDLYNRHVFAIFDAARLALCVANNLLGTNLLIAEKAGCIEYIDHRSLQAAHDIMAAAYRYRHDDGGQLLLWDDQGQYTRYASAWANWFRRQLDELAKYSDFVRPTVEAVLFKNSPMGYFAEDALSDMLIGRYDMDEWSPSGPYVKHFRHRLKRVC